jgi:hypothetical protein
VVALASARFFFAGIDALWGGGLRVGQERARGLAWSLDALAEHGSAHTALGEVAADTLSVGPVVQFYRRWTRVALRIGGGARGGAARLEGQPGAPGVHGAVAWSGWLGPLAAASLTVAPARRLALELALEGGYVAVPFGGLVSGARAVAIDGAWVGAQLGLGIFP